MADRAFLHRTWIFERDVDGVITLFTVDCGKTRADFDANPTAMVRPIADESAVQLEFPDAWHAAEFLERLVGAEQYGLPVVRDPEPIESRVVGPPVKVNMTALVPRILP